MIGSLTALKTQLENNNIHDFKSVREVIDFQNAYTSLKQQLIFRHEELIGQEKSRLRIDLTQLTETIEIQKSQTEIILYKEIDELKKQLLLSADQAPGNFLRKLIGKFKNWKNRREIGQKERKFDEEVNRSIRNLMDDYQRKNRRYQFLITNFNEAVMQSAQTHLSELDRKKTVVDGLNSLIYGSLGEQKVVKILETLSDDYFLINDFAVSFYPAIYHTQGDDYIKSVQIDHLLVGPSGIFLIETKNWSERSLESLQLRSPVDQVRRASFALFKLLNNEVGNYQLRLDAHHWGNRKIAIKNLIVLINSRPKEEFQYVKILTVDKLVSYINYFKPLFSKSETERIAHFLLGINNQKTIVTK